MKEAYWKKAYIENKVTIQTLSFSSPETLGWKSTACY